MYCEMWHESIIILTLVCLAGKCCLASLQLVQSCIDIAIGCKFSLPYNIIVLFILTLCCYSEGKIFVEYVNIFIYDLNRLSVLIFKVYITTNVF